MKDQISLSDNSKISLPVRNLIALLAAVAFGIFAYTEITARLVSLETSRQLMEQDLISKSDQKIVDQEQYLLLEMITKAQEDMELKMQEMKNNTVNLDRAVKDIEFLRDQVEKLKDKVRDNGSHQ
tara:strand:- start:89 stop:463 length:375 start_codon:yes stop_codon:yes gene_type:complete